MAIAQTGDLNERIRIISKGKESVDDYGDPTPGEDEIIYPKLFAMERTKKADEIATNPDAFRDQVQFIIRHRRRTESLITSDMTLIHLVKPENIEYQITAVNYDTQYGQWDVILCERIGQK
ncbi:head-tail adaptor protein [Companilactobacillus crustorum]|uniref:Head-tail adaptor protein n=1 Tax=Companilactobacillus nuruki TaxID=1993540 RepID=A0A2N7ATZ1_9LACO|nr:MULTISPECIES: head-tail adaptor protein [Companilactobacillus]PMD70259.1 head-tail adaptor protein [Companilactobacillus nuruki]WDT66100.1 head-tail adaptor protein [Companilactobacillus crustorum]HCD07657.1 head-tail adaptor protein [Lactobacillus sp.]